MRTVLLTTILIMAAIPSALAGVVDDWLSDLESSVGASAYNSGSRGYLSAGSVNARVSSTSEYLMSINPPRLDAGACGVDLFLGGMSYMDIDYLGDKLEAVWQNADAVALSMAMSQLSKTLDEKGIDFTEAVDFLNSLQIDECQLATQGVTAIVEGGQWAYDKLFSEEVKKQELKSGVSRNTHEVKTDAKANNDKPKSEVNIESNLYACEAPIRNLLAANGSIVSRLASAHGISNQAELIRGYIGDIYVAHVGDANAPQMAVLPPCKRNNDNGLDDFIHGLAEGRLAPTSLDVNTTGTCAPNTIAGGLIKNSSDHLYQLRDNLKNPNATINPASPLSLYLNSTPIPVYKIVKWANDIGIEDGVIQELSHVVAYSSAYAMLNDIQRMTRAAFLRMNAALTAQSTNDTLKATADATSIVPTGCNLTPYYPIIEEIKKLEVRINDSSKGLHERYLAKLEELDTFISLNRNYEK
ncbi:conjugal transfer protein TraH, partial [Oleiphilus sp. HI0128]